MTDQTTGQLPFTTTTTTQAGNRHEISTVGAHQMRVTDNLDQLLAVIPPDIRRALEQLESLSGLIEIVMDLGRDAEARFPEQKVIWLREGIAVTAEDIDHVVTHIGAFGKDNRAGIERTLHRISAIRNRVGRIVGLTLRIGRAVYGTIDIIRDVVESGKSILVLGRPGRGKTTKLREMARVLSDEFNKRVVIVDTSNEIAGDGDIPHPAIGRARRMQVAAPEQQHAVMIEAVENHMPEVIVIDEIGVEAEAFAARTIAERGVQLIGTAHGNSLENLLMNPTLSDLVGGIQAVTLSDEEARKRGTQKTVLERKAPPTFDVIIEIIEVDQLAIHHDVTKTVDRLLRGGQPRPEIRIRNADGEVEVVQPGDSDAKAPRRAAGSDLHTFGNATHDDYEPEPLPVVGRREPAPAEPHGESNGHARGKTLPPVVRLFPYGVSRSRLERAIRSLKVPAYITREVGDADVMIALKANYRKEPTRLQEGLNRNLPTYVIKSNTYIQIENVIREIFNMGASVTEEEQALQEVQDAIDEIKGDSTGGLNSVELAPQNSYTRRLQHEIAERHSMVSESIGVEPMRRVRISRP
ncbi:MAG: R3H domain-containing nucleic acid-binding protein [Capsulimonadaceae bacterium]|nr:R3H domain-containing nucleic acid-binding protein [Capsulimonadaceae bacterium]